MWRGSVVFVLVVLAFGVGIVVGLGIGGREPREHALTPPPATDASHSAAPADVLAEPAPPGQTHVSSVRSVLGAADADKHPSTSAASTGLLAANGSITVTVVDARGAPVSGATVRQRAEVNGPRGQVFAQGDFGLGSKLYTDSGGRAVLADVPFGAYRVIAETDSLAPAISAPVRVSPETPQAQAQVTLTPGGEVTGLLRDVHGVPAAAIQLSIHPNTLLSGPAPILLRQVFTGADGTFTFPRLPPGPYNLYTRAKGEDEKRVPVQSLELDVLDGQTTRAQFKDLSATAVQVAGQVLRNGQPMLRARVMVNWADMSHPMVMRTAETDAQGRFEITLDEGGEYSFSVSGESPGALTMFREKVPQVARHEFVLAFGTGSISGRALGTNGDPLPGVDVRAMGNPKDGGGRPTGGGSVTSDAQGRYAFADLPAGSYRLMASPPRNGSSAFEGMGQSESVVLEPGANLRDVDVRLSAGGAVEGRVLRRDGTAASNAQIECRGGSNRGDGAPDAQGAFTLSGLRPGVLWLRAVTEHDCSPWTSVTIAAGGTAHAELVVAPGTILLIEVEDASGPAAMASVSLTEAGSAQNQDNSQTVHVATVREGKGRTGPVPPGTYTVTARRDWRDKSGPKVESTITLTGEPEFVLKLRLP
jgi:hypothetical protein